MNNEVVMTVSIEETNLAAIDIGSNYLRIGRRHHQ